MNITSNFYRFNSQTQLTGYNNSQKKNRLQNSTHHYVNSHNNVTFKAALPEAELKSAAKTILDRSKVFGPKEYKSLSADDFDILKKYETFFRQINCNNEIINDIIQFGKMVSDRIHEKYPNGFTFVSVGRSLASCAKYMEFQGEDVKYCPASRLRGGFHRNEYFKPDFVNEYKRYLDSIGLTKELAETTKNPILISDYTFEAEGYTLENFRRLLSLPEIGISEGDMVKYTPISGMRLFDRKDWIFDYTEDPIYSVTRLKDTWFSRYYHLLANDRMKLYCSIPGFDIYDYMYGEYGKQHYGNFFNNYFNNGNKFEEKFETKMLNFIIAENAKKYTPPPKIVEPPKPLAEQYRDLGRKLERGMVVYNSDTNRTIVSTSRYTAVFNGEIPYQFYYCEGKLEHEEYLEYPSRRDKSLCSKEQRILFEYPDPESILQKDALSRLVTLERS